MIKVKSSVILTEALARILDKRQFYACAAIQDVETEMRWDKGDEIKSNAMKIFSRFQPKTVREDLKQFGEWWPKHDPRRIAALEEAIAFANKQND